MRFRGALGRIIIRLLMADTCIVPVYLGKLDLANAYMRLLFQIEYTPSVAFLITKNSLENEHLVGFHLSLPMVFVDIAPYFLWRQRRSLTLRMRQ